MSEKMEFEKIKLEAKPFDRVLGKVMEICPAAVQNGKVDFERLKAELADLVESDIKESYDFSWVGKREAIVEANTPISKTLRPCKEESVNWDSTENLYIEGDNLEVLKLLQESYLGKVKMIYIDPPYNTGKDFVYKDNFTKKKSDYELELGMEDEEGNKLFRNTETNGRFHSDWCSMIYPRLKLARDFLKDDGVIFISIDDNEVANLRKICDEVFGEDNFVAQIIWEKVHTRKNSSKYFSISHDYIIVIAKNKLNWDRILIPRDNTDAYKNPDNDPNGPWKPDPITAHNYYAANYTITKPNGIVISKPKDRYWVYSKDSWDEKVKGNEVLWGKDEAMPMVKRYLKDVQNGLVPITIFSRIFAGDSSLAKGELADFLGNGSFFDYSKPSLLIKRLLQISTRSNDIILDFFSGSATTAHAVMQLNAEDGGNRKFICVQLPEQTDEKSEAFKAGYKNICEIGKERIRRAGAKIKESIQAESGELDLLVESKKCPDTGFRVLKLDDSNMKDVYYKAQDISQSELLDNVDNIKEGRTALDLLFGIMLDWGISLSLALKENSIAGNTIYTVGDNDLIACFDNNLSAEAVEYIAKKKPMRVIFKDACFNGEDDAKINMAETFKALCNWDDNQVKNNIKVI